MTALEPCGELAPDLAEENQPESVLCKCLYVSAASQTSTEPSGRGCRSPVKPLENFKWQRGMLRQSHCWGNFQLVFAFYCKARTVSKSHKSTEKSGCTEAEDYFTPLIRTLLTSCGLF